MIIGEKRVITADDKILSREVVLEKTADGTESLKITVKAPTPRGQTSNTGAEKGSRQQPAQAKPVRPTGETG